MFLPNTSPVTSYVYDEYGRFICSKHLIYVLFILSDVIFFFCSEMLSRTKDWSRISCHIQFGSSFSKLAKLVKFHLGQVSGLSTCTLFVWFTPFFFTWEGMRKSENNSFSVSVLIHFRRQLLATSSEVHLTQGTGLLTCTLFERILSYSLHKDAKRYVSIFQG